MFIKEKHDSTIKARGCTHGRSQQEYTYEADTSSPTVSQHVQQMQKKGITLQWQIYQENSYMQIWNKMSTCF